MNGMTYWSKGKHDKWEPTKKERREEKMTKEREQKRIERNIFSLNTNQTIKSKDEQTNEFSKDKT